MTYKKGEIGNSVWGTQMILPSYKEQDEVEVEFMFNLETDEYEIIGIWMELDSGGEPVEVDVSIFPLPMMEALDILNEHKEEFTWVDKI